MKDKQEYSAEKKKKRIQGKGRPDDEKSELLLLFRLLEE